MKKLKVLQLIDSLNAGGAESIAVNLVNTLIDKNIETHLCVTRKEGSLKNNIDSQTSYLFIKRTKVIDLKAFKKLRRYVIDNKISIIHAHSTSSFIGFILKLITKDTVLIWHNHTGAYQNLKGSKLWILKIISYYFNAIINVSQDLNTWAVNNLNSKNIYYVPNFASLTDVNWKIKLKGIKGKRIVCIAGLRREKTHITLLKSFKLFLEKHQDWTLHLIGKDYHDSYSKAVLNYINKNVLNESVFLYGECSDIKNILSQATIGVLSSISEGLPVSLLEYGLAKLPVICTDVGECASVVTHELSGFIVPPKNIKKLTFYLSKLANDKELCTVFGKRLKKIVDDKYSKEQFIRTILKIYTDI